MKRALVGFFCLTVVLSISFAGCGGGGGGTPTPDSSVSVNDLDDTTGVAVNSSFVYTFAAAADKNTVTPSTFFIVPMTDPGPEAEPSVASASVLKSEYDESICNAENAISASISNSVTGLQSTLSPSSDLDYNTSYAACLTTGISYGSGSVFEGFMAVFNTEALQCDNTAIQTYSYLLAFQSCDPTLDCTNPMNHMVYLAGSDDGASWALIEDFEPISGSVPGLVFYDDYLYVFHTQGDARWQKYNACFQLAGQGDASIEGDDGLNGWVDPSLIVSGEDLVLFYLPGQGIGDPAGCGGSYPCTREIHSAVAEDQSLNSFAQQTGNRASMYIESDASEIKLFCDPDILGLSDGTYLLYVSTGGGTLVYEGTSLSQTFSIPGGGVTPVQIASVGGVPGALQAPDGSVWLYVNKNDALTMTHSIARGISADGKTPIADDAFSVVLDYTISSAFTEQRSVGSPSVINWPGQSWSRDEPPAREGN